MFADLTYLVISSLSLKCMKSMCDRLGWTFDFDFLQTTFQFQEFFLSEDVLLLLQSCHRGNPVATALPWLGSPCVLGYFSSIVFSSFSLSADSSIVNDVFSIVFHSFHPFFCTFSSLSSSFFRLQYSFLLLLADRIQYTLLFVFSHHFFQSIHHALLTCCYYVFPYFSPDLLEALTISLSYAFPHRRCASKSSSFSFFSCSSVSVVAIVSYFFIPSSQFHGHFDCRSR